MTTSFVISGSSGSWLAGSQSKQQRHAKTFSHSRLQPYAHPSHSLPPQQALPTPYGGTPEHQLLKKSTAHSNSAPGGCLQQPWASQLTPLSHHHPPYPHATHTPHSHDSASSHHGTAIVQKHHMHQEQYQSPASYTHSWSDPAPGSYTHAWSDPTKPAAKHHHPQPNPNRPPPTTHTHRLSDPTKPAPATGPYPRTDPSRFIPADNGLLTVQQHCQQPLQDATNQQLSFEAATLTPIDPPCPLGPSIPAPLPPMDPLPASRASPLPPQEPLGPSKVAPLPPWDPCTAAPLPPRNPLAPSTAGPSAVLSHPPAAAAAVAAASHSPVVLDSTIAGNPITSTHTQCIDVLPTSSQAHNAALGSEEARRGTGQAEQMTERRKTPGLKLMPSQWNLPRKVVQVRLLQPVYSHVAHSFWRRHVPTPVCRHQIQNDSVKRREWPISRSIWGWRRHLLSVNIGCFHFCYTGF